MDRALHVSAEEAQGEWVSWEEDHRDRMNPALITQLLREAVPVLDHVDWKVLEVQEGFARTVLPLTFESTNQHGTHQGALIFLAADYTGGLALGTLFRGRPVLGVHPQNGEPALALWLVKGTIDFKAPSASELVITSRVPPDRFAALRQGFAEGTRMIEPLRVEFAADGETIATAEMVYLVQQSGFLRPQSARDRVGALRRHQIKSSARLIAGLRAAEQDAAEPLFQDPYSGSAAGPHGALLARRFTEVLPPLREMVAARTRHLDDRLSASLDAGVDQVVFVGVGLDFRAFRLIGDRQAKAFEIDLAEMLVEREKVLARLGSLPPVDRRAVPLNLEFDDLAETLSARTDFDPERPTFIVFEGASMYFRDEVNDRLFGSMLRLLRHPQSRLWTDVVAASVIAGATGRREAEAFVTGMAKLGEPFIFGLDDPAAYFSRLGYEHVSMDGSDLYGRAPQDPIYALYRFVLLRASPRAPRPESA